MPNFLTLAEVAKKLHTSVSGVKSMIKQGRLDAVKVNALTTVVNETALDNIRPAAASKKPAANTKGLEALKAYHDNKKKAVTGPPPERAIKKPTSKQNPKTPLQLSQESSPQI